MIGLDDLLCLLLILCVGMFNFALFVWLYLELLQVAFAFCLVRFGYYCWLVVINGHECCGWVLGVMFGGCCECGLLAGLLCCVADFLACFVLLCSRFWVC